jgi:hypothetical protein
LEHLFYGIKLILHTFPYIHIRGYKVPHTEYKNVIRTWPKCGLKDKH